MVDTDKYLPYALKLFEKQGGLLREGYIQNFQELEDRYVVWKYCKSNNNRHRPIVKSNNSWNLRIGMETDTKVVGLNLVSSS